MWFPEIFKLTIWLLPPVWFSTPIKRPLLFEEKFKSKTQFKIEEFYIFVWKKSKMEVFKVVMFSSICTHVNWVTT